MFFSIYCLRSAEELNIPSWKPQSDYTTSIHTDRGWTGISPDDGGEDHSKSAPGWRILAWNQSHGGHVHPCGIETHETAETCGYQWFLWGGDILYLLISWLWNAFNPTGFRDTTKLWLYILLCSYWPQPHQAWESRGFCTCWSTSGTWRSAIHNPGQSKNPPHPSTTAQRRKSKRESEHYR